MNDITTITRSNGKQYAVRANRDRFFFPEEWFKFYDSLVANQPLTFKFLMNTGARINEARHVTVGDIDFLNKRLILRVTKVKAKKKEKNPRPRTIGLSTQFTAWLKKQVRGKANDQYIGVLATNSANTAMKKALKKCGVEDYYMFSIHNIRKSHGNFLKAMGVDGAEICTRLGHDYNTFLKSYSSPDIFSYDEKNKIRMILGDLYQK